MGDALLLSIYFQLSSVVIYNHFIQQLFCAPLELHRALESPCPQKHSSRRTALAPRNDQHQKRSYGRQRRASCAVHHSESCAPPHCSALCRSSLEQLLHPPHAMLQQQLCHLLVAVQQGQLRSGSEAKQSGSEAKRSGSAVLLHIALCDV